MNWKMINKEVLGETLQHILFGTIIVSSFSLMLCIVIFSIHHPICSDPVQKYIADNVQMQ